MCGCPKKKAVFCFPCILFGGDESWTKTGIIDLAHLHVNASRHETSSAHLNNSMSLAVFGKSSIQNFLCDAYRNGIVAHNEKVSNNRYILSKIINCIKFCGVFELPSSGHTETKDSENPGVFN